MNSNWERWINSSVAKYIKGICDTNNVSLFVEGSPRNTEELQDWVELRIDGPSWHGATKDEWVAHLEINILILSKMNQVDNSRLLKNIGLMRTALSQTIPVLKLGKEVQDDQSHITCLILKNTGKESLEVNQLGQVTENTQLQRATVDGMFFANFEG